MSLLNKKIRREAKRNHLMQRDLENAVEALTRHNSRQHLEAQIYTDAITYDSEKLWEVAREVIQFNKDGEAIS